MAIRRSWLRPPPANTPPLCTPVLCTTRLRIPKLHITRLLRIPKLHITRLRIPKLHITRLRPIIPPNHSRKNPPVEARRKRKRSNSSLEAGGSPCDLEHARVSEAARVQNIYLSERSPFGPGGVISI